MKSEQLMLAATCGITLLMLGTSPGWAQQAPTAPIQPTQITPVNPLVSSAASPITADAPAAAPVVVADDYRLDTDDTVAIEVQRHEQVSRTYRVPVDGKLRLPRLVTPIVARGRTATELAEVITDKLQSEGKLRLRPGQVSVAVVGVRMRHVYVTGTAGKNGDFNLQNNWRVRELIAATGGISQAERVSAQINNPNRPGPVKINLSRALTEPDSADNVQLLENDTLVLRLPERKRLSIKGEGPRGTKEIDERFGLRQALIEFGFSTTGATGDLRKAQLLRHEVPGDTNTPQTVIPVDLYTLMTDENTPDVPLQDMDVLDIPVSQNFVYIFGRTNAPKKFYLPEDRPTYLIDIMALGDTFGDARIGSVTVVRRENAKPGGAAFNAQTGSDMGKVTQREYDFGKFLAKKDFNQNPQILPGDMIIVPNVKRTDVPSTIWTGWGLFNIMQSLVPGLRLR